MAEEKLKNFGELLHETLGQRFGEEIKPVDDPITLSDAERNAVFERLAKAQPKADKTVEKKVVDISGEDTSLLPFGELLERTIKARTESEKIDNTAEDELREAVIGKSKISLMDDLMGKFLK